MLLLPLLPTRDWNLQEPLLGVPGSRAEMGKQRSQDKEIRHAGPGLQKSRIPNMSAMAFDPGDWEYLVLPSPILRVHPTYHLSSQKVVLGRGEHTVCQSHVVSSVPRCPDHAHALQGDGSSVWRGACVRCVCQLCSVPDPRLELLHLRGSWWCPPAQSCLTTQCESVPRNSPLVII